jgi:hypothetical protein
LEKDLHVEEDLTKRAARRLLWKGVRKSVVCNRSFLAWGNHGSSIPAA